MSDLQDILGFNTSSGGGSSDYEPLDTTVFQDAIVHAVVRLGKHTSEEFVYQGKKIPAKTDEFIKIIFEIPVDAETSRYVSTGSYLRNTLFKGPAAASSLFKVVGGILQVTTTEEAEAKLAASMAETGNPYNCLLDKAVTLKVVNTQKGGQKVDPASVQVLDSRIKPPVSTSKEGSFVFHPALPGAAKVFKERLNKYDQKRIMDSEDADKYPAELQEAFKEVLEDSEEKPDVDSVIG